MITLGNTRGATSRRHCRCGQTIQPGFKFCPGCARPVGVERLCATLQRLAVNTFERLSHDYRTKLHPSEETLTDDHLEAIDEAHGHRIQVTKYTRAKEAGNGADWEWWFHHGSGTGFGVRVQAKIQDRQHHYLLNSTAGSSGRLQIDVLIDDASKSGALPFYVLYNHRNRSEADTAGRECPHVPIDQRHWGCSMASALAVRSVMNSQTRHQETFKASWPWHVVLCEVIGTPQRPTTTHGLVNDLYREGRGRLRCAIGFGPGHNSAPGTVVDDEALQRLDRIAEYGADHPLPDHINRIIASRGKPTTGPDPRAAGAVVVDLTAL